MYYKSTCFLYPFEWRSHHYIYACVNYRSGTVRSPLNCLAASFVGNEANAKIVCEYHLNDAITIYYFTFSIIKVDGVHSFTFSSYLENCTMATILECFLFPGRPESD